MTTADDQVIERTSSPGRWALAAARSVVFLVDAGGLERRLLDQWIARNKPAGASVEVLRVPSTRRRDLGPLDRALVDCLAFLYERSAAGEDPLLAPLRIAWLPRERNGERSVAFFDLLTLGNPRAPGPIGKRWVLARHPDRCQVIAGEPAPVSALKERWRRAGGDESEGSTHRVDGRPSAAAAGAFAEFVMRQATLALERAERPLKGARYKVPRFVHEEITSRREFHAGVEALAGETKLPRARVEKRAHRYLREIAARVSPYVIDLVHRAIRRVYRRGYGEEILYDRATLQAILARGNRHTVVFLPTHKSNLDHAILQFLLYENGYPPNHTAGGINMNFFPIGPLFRRTGVFFIRRTFKDNPVYKFVLRQYVDFLVEKRFSMEWYIEGGRSRSGKLLPPRFGMLNYVVDAWRRGKSEDVLLVPVSIAYDQISDVGDYSHEARGGKKQKEGLGWFVKMIRGLMRTYGNIHVRLGDPISLRAALGTPDPHAPAADPEEKNLPVQKLAFEVCNRINRATPITPNAAIAMAMLGAGERAVSVEELLRLLHNLVQYARRRGLPSTTPLDDLETTEGVTRHLRALAANGVLTCFDEGPEPVWAIATEHYLTAAYYRNTILHFFLTSSIAEIALLHAASASGDARQAFHEEAMRLRDLLKFEFFFAEKDAFRKELEAEVAFHAPDWEGALARGEEAMESVVRRFKPFSAHRTLRPFVDAYRIVADVLLRQDPAAKTDENALVSACLALGRQYVLQKRVHTAESVSKVLFGTALKLAANRGLLTGDDLARKRRAFADQLKDVVRRLDAMESLAASRRAGLIE